jgi:hypothetical protein
LSASCLHRRRPSEFNVFDRSKTHQQVNDATLFWIDELQCRGMSDNAQLMVKWECEILYQKKIDSEFAIFWRSMKHIDWNLRIRDSLFGGRVEVVALHVKVTPEQRQQGYRLRYHDFVSMYPELLLTQAFPCSRARTMYAPPVCHVLDRNKKLLYGGVIAALVLPKANLPVGFLPVRLKSVSTEDEQVFYPLCRTCAINGIHGCHRLTECNHGDHARAFRGTWTSIELQFAIDNGYQLLCVYQVC